MRVSLSFWSAFRNLSPAKIHWAAGLTLLLGPNGVGKTNVLEFFSILTGWGPLPGRKTRDVATWIEEHEDPSSSPRRALLSAVFEGEESVEAAAACGRQTFLSREKRRVAASEMRCAVPSLFFGPQDLALIEGGPSVRRRFLDRIAALLAPLYALRLHEYKRALSVRSALVRNGKDPRMTTPLLLPLAAWIWKIRGGVAEALARLLVEENMLAPSGVEVRYGRGGSLGIEDLEEDFAAAVQKNAPRERASGVLPVGPHRDDMLLFWGGRNAEISLSRGQRRRLAVALLLAAGMVVERKLRRKPVLLLDEVAAELDHQAREQLFHALEKTGWQVIAATAEDPVAPWPGDVRVMKAGVLCDRV